MRFKKNLQVILEKILERNFLIVLMSFSILSISLFSRNGIIPAFKKYVEEKKSHQKILYLLKQKMQNLEEKIQLLEKNHPEILEEITFHYKNITPYNQGQYTLIDLERSEK